MGYIYKIVNNINDAVYIGQTTASLQERFYKHSWDAKNRKKTTCPLHNAMSKYGVEHFAIEQIEECPNQLLSEREKYWILQYDAYHSGYNATLGGEGNSKLDEQEIIQLWEAGLNQTEIAEKLSCDRHTIKKYLDTNGISQPDRLNKKYGNAAKPILQIKPNSGEVINEFESATIAANKTNSNLSGISQVCSGRRKTHNGYIWKYKQTQ